MLLYKKKNNKTEKKSCDETEIQHEFQLGTGNLDFWKHQENKFNSLFCLAFLSERDTEKYCSIVLHYLAGACFGVRQIV